MKSRVEQKEKTLTTKHSVLSSIKHKGKKQKIKQNTTNNKTVNYKVIRHTIQLTEEDARNRSDDIKDILVKALLRNTSKSNIESGSVENSLTVSKENHITAS